MNWESISKEDLEFVKDMMRLESEEPMPATEIVEDLKALGDLIGVDVEEL